MDNQPITDLMTFAQHPAIGACSKSNQPAVAQNIMTERYKRHRLRCLSDDRDFDFLHVGTEVPVGTFNILRYGSDVEIDAGTFKDFFMLEMPVSGGAHVQQGGTHIRSDMKTALFLSPDQRIHSFWAKGTTQLMLKIKRSELITRWQGRQCDPMARLPDMPPTIDLTNAAGWRIRQLMHLLYEEIARNLQAGDQSVNRTPLAAAIIDSLFEYWSEMHGDLTAADRRKILPVHVKKSVSYIDANLGEDLKVSTLADIGGVSERALYDGYLRFLQRSPKQYILERRLHRAREDLVAGNGTVADIARRYGIHHLGRFSQYYRQRYGENPSETLSAGSA